MTRAMPDGQIPGTPKVPVDLRLSPCPADHALANCPFEQAEQHPLDASGVGPCQIDRRSAIVAFRGIGVKLIQPPQRQNPTRLHGFGTMPSFYANPCCQSC